TPTSEAAWFVRAYRPPFSLEKRKFVFAPPTWKLPAVLLNTTPVGAGTVTCVALGTLLAGVIVEVSEPLLAGHHGVVGPATRPHGFTRRASARSAGTIAVLLDTMLWTRYWSLVACAGAAAISAAAAVRTPRAKRLGTAMGLLPRTPEHADAGTLRRHP